MAVEEVVVEVATAETLVVVDEYDEQVIVQELSSPNVVEVMAGSQGVPGPPPVLTFPAVVTGAAGTNASLSVSGDNMSGYNLALTIPRGNTGATGPAPNMAIGTVTNATPGQNASATITGTNPNYSLNLSIPVANWTIGTVSTVAVGGSATATIGGTALNPTLNIGIPTGATGATGPAPTLNQPTVTSLSPVSTPTATFSGSNPYTLQLGLPAAPQILSGATAPTAGTGQQGFWYINTATWDMSEKTSSTVWTTRLNLRGATGPAPTFNSAVTVTTGAPGSAASASISGSNPYSLNLTIPRGDVGATPTINSTINVTTGAAGTSASASWSGTNPYTLNITVPRGDPGTGNVTSQGALTVGNLASWNTTGGFIQDAGIAANNVQLKSSTTGGVKRYVDLHRNYFYNGSGQVGWLVVKTNIPSTATAMVDVDFTIRNFSNNYTSRGTATVYLYNSAGGTLYQPKWATVGTTPVYCYMAKDASNNWVLIFSQSGNPATATNWAYSYVSADELRVHFGTITDVQAQGFTSSLDTDISQYTSTLVTPATTDLAVAYSLASSAEQAANKSTLVTLGTSNTLYPTQGAVKSYVDTGLAGKSDTTHGHALTDANITGVLPIAQVPTGTTGTTVALGNHNHDSVYVALSGAQSINGVKTFTSAPVFSSGIQVTGGVVATSTVSGSNIYGGNTQATGSVPSGGASAAVNPTVTAVMTSGAAAIGVYVPDGTNNRRAALVMNQTDGVWGLTQTQTSGAIPFVVMTNGAEYFRIDPTGTPLISLKANTAVTGTLSSTAGFSATTGTFSSTISATGATLSGLTASRVVTTSTGGLLAVSAVTTTELGYLSGVTSAVQTQLNAKEGTLTAGTTAQYYRGDKTWQTLNVAAVSGAAPLASPTFTGTVSGITKAMVGLGNVDNTSDLSKPISTATQNALNLKAPLASPTFTGVVSAADVNLTGGLTVTGTLDVAGGGLVQVDELYTLAFEAKSGNFGYVDTDVVLDRSVRVEVDQRGNTFTYTDGVLTGAVEKSGSTTVRSTTFTYTDGLLTQSVEVASGQTITTTFTYTDGLLTGTSKTVA